MERESEMEYLTRMVDFLVEAHVREQVVAMNSFPPGPKTWLTPYEVDRAVSDRLTIIRRTTPC